MIKRNALLMTVTLATAAFTVTLHAPDAQAQGRRNRGGQNGGAVGGGQNGGGFGGFGQNGGRGGFGLNGAAQHDPAKSALPILIPRDDVKSEILLSQRQSEQFDAEQKAAQDAMQKKMDDAQSSLPDRSTLQNLSQEERRAKMTEFRQKMTEARTEAQAATADEIEKKALTILTPEQLKRIHELDLQWRGPLALTDTKVGEKFEMTPDQKGKLGELLKVSQTEQQAVLREAMNAIRPPRQRRGNRNGGANGAAPGAPADPNTPAADAGAAVPAPLTPEQIQAKIMEAQAKADKIRLDYDTKALAVLTDSQKVAWTAAQGKKFTFRPTEIKPNAGN